MLTEPPTSSRELHNVHLSSDLVVVGGGLAGLCCAVTAAREGLKVVLVQDRPVLGGNASSEVRLWTLGATCHMVSNNRWAREGGVINEIMMKNLWRNPEGNALFFDSLLLEMVCEEPNVTLLLNTACFDVVKETEDHIAGVKAYCSQNETLYDIEARLFCDASGDGVVGFLAGAAFRMGAESKEEFGEAFAPAGDFGYLLGHSLYFYSRDAGRPVRFVAPSFALKNVEEKIPRYRHFNTREQGCELWWIEWGGRMDTIHDTEKIKWELWKVVYGVWDHIKNSGKFPESENLTLEWVGHIPGKRESRRFEGDYMLRQQDIVERRYHHDSVAFGGWSIDLHPADGVFSEIQGSLHLRSKGMYSIPYRCYYSRNINNLFLAGRIISCSHVGFGSTRVMATCAVGGQAVAHAAALCQRHGVLPRDIGQEKYLDALQQNILRTGGYIPRLPGKDPLDLARQARPSASSVFQLKELPSGGPRLPLSRSCAQMIPVTAGAVPEMTFWADVTERTELQIELRAPSDPWHHSPDILLERKTISLEAGQSIPIQWTFAHHQTHSGYLFVHFLKNPDVAIHTSPLRLSGLLRLDEGREQKNSHVGGEDFPVYAPERRPKGYNLAFRLSQAQKVFEPENVFNGFQRPNSEPNAWVADPGDAAPSFRLDWDQSVTVQEIHLFCDGDFDHAMESVLMGHPERAVVFCVKRYEILDDKGNLIGSGEDQHCSHVIHRLKNSVETRSIIVRILETWGAPAALFEIRCYK